MTAATLGRAWTDQSPRVQSAAGTTFPRGIVNLILSILSTLGTLVLVVATFVVFETSHARTSAQRGQFANVVWPLAGLVVIAIWVWYFKAKHKQKRR